MCADVLVVHSTVGPIWEHFTRVGRFKKCGVGIPVNIVSLALDPGIEGSEVGHNHTISELVPVT
jgi:hypothetical protein